MQSEEEKRVYSSKYALSGIVYGPRCSEICRLRKERQAILLQDAECDGKRQRIEKIRAFLGEQASIPAEYDEQFVRRQIETGMLCRYKLSLQGGFQMYSILHLSTI